VTVRWTAFWATLAAGCGAVAGALVAAELAPSARDGLAWRAFPWAIGLATATCCAAVVANRVGRTLTRRLTELGDAAEALAQDPSSRAADQRARDPEFVRLHRAIDAVGRSLQDVLERERSFARYASHELRTPVGALKVQIERVELGAASAADVLPAVARQTARIEELIDALLALTRTRERRSRVQPLPKLLHESVESLGEAERNRVYFVEPVPDVLVRESVLVRQALRNLLDNAVRHGAGPVTVRVERADDALTLRVRDMGGGIPGTELRRMAEPSDRRAPRPDGHGLGLTLVALIARALDGRLLLHNTEIGLEASLTVTVVVDAGA
jgi:signal transduction histidine kinase